MKFGVNCRYDDILRDDVVSKLKQERINFVELHKIPERININELDRIKGQFEYSLHASVDFRIHPLLSFGYHISEVKKIENEIDFAIASNIKEIVMHGGSFFKGYIRLSKILRRNIGLNFFLDTFSKNFGPILKKAHNHKIKILIENCYPCYLLGRPYDIRYLKYKFPFLGFCFDLAHSEIYNQTEELMKIDIDHIHLTDNNKRIDQHLEIGKGSIDFKDFFRKLKAKNYNKKIILECNKLQDSIESINKIKSWDI